MCALRLKTGFPTENRTKYENGATDSNREFGNEENIIKDDASNLE